jgi:hypothetical protein
MANCLFSILLDINFSFLLQLTFSPWRLIILYLTYFR